jgi:opacity protein-like surface antigen
VITSNEINANLESQSGGDPLPSPTIDNGLAGATNFIPDNIDLAPGLNGRRYFEVSMSNAGITTLSSTRTIDRLNVGGNAELVIGSTGNLTSLMDINQTGGHISVDGALNSVGDYTLFFGYLTGAGILNSPFLTNIAGTIAPGDIGNIETLTIDGSAVLSSGSSLMIDIGSNGISDVLSITGDSSLGGTVFFNPNLGVRSGNTYTFLTTSGLQSGELSAANISSILTPVLTHNINSVTALIEAGSYNNAISTSNSLHASYAKLLDSNRDLGGLDAVYATLDLSSDSQIQEVLTSWAPEAEMTVRSLAKATTDTLSQFHSSRLRIMETGSWSGGSISVMGSPGKIASHQDAMAPMSNVEVSDMDNEASIKTNKKIADDYSIYLAGSFIDGSASVMPFSSNLEKEHFDGWTLSAGIEHAVSENIKLGASLSYTDLSLNDQAAKSVNSNHAAVTLYGQLQSKSNLVLSGQFSIGSFDTSTERNIVFPASYALSSEDENLSVTSKIQLSKPLKMSDFTLIPKVGLQTAMVDFNDVLETGGITALNIDRKYYSSTQGRLGLDIVSNKNSNFYMRISGDVVNEFDDSLNVFRAGFAQNNGESANFLLAGTDQFWGEVGAGFAFEIDKAVMSLSVDTTVGRDDLSTQSYRAGITFKF